MKKVSKRFIQWSARSLVAQLWRERRLRGIHRQRKSLIGHKRSYSNAKIRLPGTLSLGGSERRANLMVAIRKLKESAYDKRISIITIDFSKVKELHPCGTLLFLAELERLFESPVVGKKLAATYPTDSVVEQMLQHIGLLQRLGLPPRIENIIADNVVSWLHASGTEGELDSIADILPKVLTEGSNMELRIALLSGMAEAVANSSEHAYKKSIGGADERKKWWLFARQVGDEVAVAICDLGLGIPGTLESNWKEEVATILKTRSGLKRLDHKMIQLAFTVGKTSTDRRNRGKGLKDILKVVHEQQVGSIFIYSNKGIYVMDNADATKVSRDEKVSINGTIIMWKIPIEAFGFDEAGRK
ncbi:hypothetical protein [Pseudomonas graminis]|uniref:hypothetical protein n=1 Tax=Pseudomonas graminis TaxID=158627 RepID=UPI003C13FE63